MMGNLILASEKLNDKLKNKSFIQKKAILKRAKYPLNEILVDATEWTDKRIRERTKHLAKLVHKKVFKV